jgi:hypothetical protein
MEDRMDYAPAKNTRQVGLGRRDCPLVVLRSHPSFPNTLSPEMDGEFIGAAPNFLEMGIDRILLSLDPPCHANWRRDFRSDNVEERNGVRLLVLYVRPGHA